MLGIALMALGGFALLMMHVTGNIPDQLPMKWRHEDPWAFRFWWYAYVLVAGLGAAILLLSMLRPG